MKNEDLKKLLQQAAIAGIIAAATVLINGLKNHLEYQN